MSDSSSPLMPGPDWTPVAERAVWAFGTWPQWTQIAVSISATTVLLAGIAAWYLNRRHSDSGMVPAAILVSMTEEFSRQVGHMAMVVEGLSAVVEDLRDSIKGCSTCHYNPHNFNKRED